MFDGENVKRTRTSRLTVSAGRAHHRGDDVGNPGNNPEFAAHDTLTRSACGAPDSRGEYARSGPWRRCGRSSGGTRRRCYAAGAIAAHAASAPSDVSSPTRPTERPLPLLRQLPTAPSDECMAT